MGRVKDLIELEQKLQKLLNEIEYEDSGGSAMSNDNQGKVTFEFRPSKMKDPDPKHVSGMSAIEFGKDYGDGEIIAEDAKIDFDFHTKLLPPPPDFIIPKVDTASVPQVSSEAVALASATLKAMNVSPLLLKDFSVKADAGSLSNSGKSGKVRPNMSLFEDLLSKGLHKPTLGTVDGLPVIAIGPKGGKIVGYDAKGKPIYAGSATAKKMAAAKKDKTADSITKWLDGMGIKAKWTLSKDGVVVSVDEGKQLQESFGISPVKKNVAGYKFKLEALKPHLGHGLKPANLLDVQAAEASGTKDDKWPSPADLIEIPAGKFAGTHGNRLFKTKDGTKYLFKGKNEVIARAEEAASRLGVMLLGPDRVQRAKAITLGGKTGALIPISDITPLASQGKTVSNAKLQKYAAEIVQHHVFDWLIAQHDTHAENLQIGDKGLLAIDKGQAFKLAGQDKLAHDYTPNEFKQVYQDFWNAQKKGKVKVDAAAEAAKVLSAAESLSEEQLKSVLAPYIDAYADKHSLSSAQEVEQQILDRFKEAHDNWENFLGESIKLSPQAAVAKPKQKIQDTTTPPVNAPEGFKPVKKGTATLLSPGSSDKPAGWPSGYPGPGFTIDVKYKGGVHHVEFGAKVDGSMSVMVTYPSGMTANYASPNEAADSFVLNAKGLDLAMSATEKKKAKISYSATKLFKLKEFAQELTEHASATPPAPAPETTKKTVTVAEQLKAYLGSELKKIVDDHSLLPVAIQDFVKAHKSQVLVRKGYAKVVLYTSKYDGDGNPEYHTWNLLDDGEIIKLAVGPTPFSSVKDTAVEVKDTAVELKPAPEKASQPKAEPIKKTPLTITTPKSAPKSFAGPLAPGTQIKVKKKFSWAKGKQEVLLQVNNDGSFTVSIPIEGSPIPATDTFKTLSAASDHVWVNQKGHVSVAAYKQATGKKKIASGGGWKFWGVKPTDPPKPSKTPLEVPDPDPVTTPSEDNFETMPVSDVSLAHVKSADPGEKWSTTTSSNWKIAAVKQVSGWNVILTNPTGATFPETYSDIEFATYMKNLSADSITIEHVEDAPDPAPTKTPLTVPATPGVSTVPYATITGDFLDTLSEGTELEWTEKDGGTYTAVNKGIYWQLTSKVPGSSEAVSNEGPLVLAYLINAGGVPNGAVSITKPGDKSPEVTPPKSAASYDLKAEAITIPVLSGMPIGTAVTWTDVNGWVYDAVKTSIGWDLLIQDPDKPSPYKNTNYLAFEILKYINSDLITVTPPGADTPPESTPSAASELAASAITPPLLQAMIGSTKLTWIDKVGNSHEAIKTATDSSVWMYTNTVEPQPISFSSGAIAIIITDSDDDASPVDGKVQVSLDVATTSATVPVGESADNWQTIDPSGVTTEWLNSLPEGSEFSVKTKDPSESDMTGKKEGDFWILNVNDVQYVGSPSVAASALTTAKASGKVAYKTPDTTPKVPLASAVITKQPEDMTPAEAATDVLADVSFLDAFEHLDIVKNNPGLILIPASFTGAYNMIFNKDEQTPPLTDAQIEALFEKIISEYGLKKKFSTHPKIKPKSAFVTFDTVELLEPIKAKMAAASVPPLDVKNNFETMPDVVSPSGAKIPKKIYKTWSVKKKQEVLNDLPLDTKLTLGHGVVYQKVAQTGMQWKVAEHPSNPAVVGASTSTWLVADKIKITGGAAVTAPGATPAVTPPPPPAPKPQPVKFTPKPLDSNLQKKKDWLKKTKPLTADVKERLAHLFATAGISDLPVVARMDGNAILLTADEDLKAKLDPFVLIDSTVVDTPYGKAYKIWPIDLEGATPEAGTIKGPDGVMYPHGTTFKTKKTFMKVEQHLEQEKGFQKYSDAKPGTAHSKAAKFSKGVDVAAIQKKYDLDGPTKSGNQYDMVLLTQDELDKNHGDPKLEVTPTIPAQPSPIKSKPLGITSEVPPEGHPAPTNYDDLSQAADIVPFQHGYSIRFGQGGLLTDGQLRMHKIKMPDGTDIMRFVGDLTKDTPDLNVNVKCPMLSSQTKDDSIISGKKADVFDPETGFHQLSSNSIWSYATNSFSGAELGNDAKVYTFGNDITTLRRTFVVDVPINGDAPQALHEALTKLGVDADSAMAAPDEQDERIMIKMQLLRSSIGPNGFLQIAKMNLMDKTKAEREAFLDNALKGKIAKKFIDTARVEVGADGYHNVVADDLDESLKTVSCVTTGISTEGIAKMLKEKAYGGQAQTLWTGNSLNIDGGGGTASGHADMLSGGGFGKFFRIQNDKIKSTGGVGGGKPKLILHPRVLKKTNWFAHNGDHYGSQNKSGRTRKTATTMNSSANEIIIESSSIKDVAGALVGNTSEKQNLIKYLKALGYGSGINGIPLKDFVVVGDTSAPGKEANAGKFVGLKEGVLP